MKETAFLLTGRQSVANVNKNRCVLIKPCEKISMSQQGSSNDANKAAMFLQLRDKGCDKKKALLFSKKKYCKYDQTKTVDGPVSYRKLKPQKPKTFKTHYGWDLSGDVNFQVGDIKFYDIAKKSKKMKKEQYEAALLQKQALSKNLKNINSIESQMKNLNNYFDKIDKKVKSCNDLTVFQKRDWANNLVQKTNNEITQNRKYVSIPVQDENTERNQLNLYEIAKEIKVIPKKKRSQFNSQNQKFLINKLQAFPDEVMDQVKNNCRIQDPNELERDKVLSSERQSQSQNQKQKMKFFCVFDQFEEEEKELSQKKKVIENYKKKYYLAYDKDEIINQNNESIKKLKFQSQSVDQQQLNLMTDQYQSLSPKNQPQQFYGGILKKKDKDNNFKNKTMLNININSQIQIKNEDNSNKQIQQGGLSQMGRSSMAQSQMQKSFTGKSSLNKSQNQHSLVNLNSNRPRKPTLNLNFKTEEDDDVESQIEVSFEVYNDQNINSKKQAYFQITESPISNQQIQKLNKYQQNLLLKGNQTPNMKSYNNYYVSNTNSNNNIIINNNNMSISNSNQVRFNDTSLNSSRRSLIKQNKGKQDQLKLIMEGGALDYDKKIGDKNLDEFNAKLKNWVQNQTNSSFNKNNSQKFNGDDQVYCNLFNILEKQKQTREQVIEKHNKQLSKEEILQRKQYVKQFYTKQYGSNPNLASNSKLFNTFNSNSNKKTNKGSYFNLMETQSTLNPDYYLKTCSSMSNQKLEKIQSQDFIQSPNNHNKISGFKSEKKNVNFNIKSNNLTSVHDNFSSENEDDDDDEMSESQYINNLNINKMGKRRDQQSIISGAQSQQIILQHSKQRKYIKPIISNNK